MRYNTLWMALSGEASHHRFTRFRTLTLGLILRIASFVLLGCNACARRRACRWALFSFLIVADIRSCKPVLTVGRAGLPQLDTNVGLISVARAESGCLYTFGARLL